jgi:UDP-N-acetylglucosamine 2-epimerase (non-hydrolysing)
LKALFVYGTRPEAIKLAPLILAMKREPERFEVKVCLTGQHREMLDQVNEFFGISAEYDLAIMKANQSLSDLTARCLIALDPVLESADPDLVIVQGDTTTVMAAALASYYRKKPVAHVEAGLRSWNIYSPFPEEVNRRIAGQIARYHFAPSTGAVENLRRDGIEEDVFLVGNTVIDSLHLGLEIIRTRGDEPFRRRFAFLDSDRKNILVTAHRRESFNGGFGSIFTAIRNIAQSHDDVFIVFPVHLNPHVREPALRILSGIPNVHLLDPLDYPSMIWVLQISYIVLTDSGGIQEEAPALGKPVLVLRDVTERMEGVEAGTARLVGTDGESISRNVEALLDGASEYEAMARSINPYGDGRACERILGSLP